VVNSFLSLFVVNLHKMKTFYFKSNDNIYKIFQLIDKLNRRYKEVIFDIDYRNEFFSNKWWMKLVLEKAKDKWVNIIFVIENKKQEDFMKIFSANYIWRKKPIYKKIKQIISELLYIIKTEHSFYSRHYNFFKILFLILEVWFIIFFVYFVYNIVTPKTDIYIQPTVNIKHLITNFYIYPASVNNKDKYSLSRRIHIPYYEKVFTKMYDIKIPVQDISYITKPSKWLIKFVNTTSKWISLKAYTEMITDDWILFRLNNWVYIPPKSWEWKPWEVFVKITAEQKDVKWNIVWVRWNISKWTKLYIRKMYISSVKKQIYAVAVDEFNWWETNSVWTVTLQDIQNLKKYLLSNFENDLKKNIINYVKFDWWDIIPLLYEKMYWYKNVSYHIYAKPWDKKPYVKWDVQADIYFYYINKKDIKEWFKKYLLDRIVSENEFLWWDDNSIELLQFVNITNNLYLITVNISALLWYDFDVDYNNVISQVIEQVKWKDIQQAKSIILSYPMVAGVEIKTTDSLQKVSSLESRIFIHISK